MDEQNEKWSAEGMRSDRSDPEPSTPTGAARIALAGDEFEYGRPARASFNLFAFAALLVEVIAFIILIPIQTTAPAFSCFDVQYRQWLARMDILYTTALLMIPLGLLLALVGYFMQKRKPWLLGKSAWVAALLIGVLVNPAWWLAGLGPMTREFGCL